MTAWDYSRPWYHGSPRQFTVLRAGSSVSQDKNLARVFSHRPSLISVGDDGTIKHNGTIAGYLYVVAEGIKPEDVYPHPHPANAGRWEWLTKRELPVQLIERTEVRKEERLTNEEIAALRRKQELEGTETFAE